MLEVIINYIKKILEYIKNTFKYTRGVRVLKCKVDENGKKIIVFQALGSFHSEEIEYEEYKNGLIYDTEPSDVEQVSIFFHCSHFEKYKIYCFDTVNNVISICDSLHNNIINITSENWTESIKYLKHMNNLEAQHVVNSIINFEISNYINSINEIPDNNDEDTNKNDLNLEDLEFSNVIKIQNYKK